MQSLHSSDHMLNVDTDLEAGVLGNVLATPTKAIDRIRYLPKQACFTGVIHQNLYLALVDLHSRGREIDLLATKRYLGQYAQRMLWVSTDPTTDALRLLGKVNTDPGDCSLRQLNLTDHLRQLVEELDWQDGRGRS